MSPVKMRKKSAIKRTQKMTQNFLNNEKYKGEKDEISYRLRRVSS